jgi:transcriptional regulator with XRE-family HTH domain
MTFGTFFKNKRMKTDLSLRQFCKSKGLDPAYISRIENDIIPAPNKQSLLETLAKALDIKETTPEWVEFFDLAFVSKGEMPEDIQENFPEVLAYLPAFLRSVKKNKVTKEDVNELVDLVKAGYDEPDTE